VSIIGHQRRFASELDQEELRQRKANAAYPNLRTSCQSWLRHVSSSDRATGFTQLAIRF